MKLLIKHINTLGMLLLMAVLLSPIVSSAEDYGLDLPLMPKVVNSDLTLDAGNYVVKGDVRVKSNATLTVNSGTNLIFERNAKLIVEGGLNIQGRNKGFVNIVSRNVLLPGIGILVKDVNPDKRINIKHARFNNLFAPIKFNKLWYRASAEVNENVIKNSPHGGAAIDIQLVDTLLASETVKFRFERNTFCNNSSSILISDVSNSGTQFFISENVITRNDYSGVERNGIYTCPLFMTYNEFNGNHAQFSSNSIFDNFSSLYLADTFEVNYTNVSIIGSRNDVDLSGNYFGDKRHDEINKTFDYISSSYRAPYLHSERTLSKPPSDINGHFYKVMINDQPLKEALYFANLGKSINEIDVAFNRPIGIGANFNIRYFYLDNDTFKYANIDNRLTWIDNNKRVKISIENKIIMSHPKGFLSIDGFYDQNGFDVPRLDIGKKALKSFVPATLASPIDFDMAIKQSAQQDPTNKKGQNDEGIAQVKTMEQIIDSLKNELEAVKLEKDPINDSLIKQRSNYWDAGLFVGNAIYFGDLQRTGIGFNINNARACVGLRASYHLSDKSTIRLFNNYMYIAGTDVIDPNQSNSRGTGFSRNLSFRTSIIDFGATYEYNLIRFKSVKTYVPALFAGFNAYYFKPEANYQGKWYDLRNLGTEGQNVASSPLKPYKSLLFGIPMGATLKKHVSQDVILGVSYTFNKIFTDYLDDISTGLFQSQDDFNAVNPETAEVASQVSNPSGLSGQRSTSADFDAYSFWGLTVTYKIPNRKKQKVATLEVTDSGI